jgi:hypothetical protein
MEKLLYNPFKRELICMKDGKPVKGYIGDNAVKKLFELINKNIEVAMVDDRRAKLLKKYHTLCSVLNISAENKKVIVGEYGKSSSRELSWAELSEICTNLEKLQSGKQGSELDKARKRVIAVIGAYLRQTGQKESIDIIKGIACRATSYAKFNDIPIERLRNIYYCFKNKNEDKKNIDSLIGENLTNLSNLN